ncbi:Anaphase-promoting complex subunit [Musa troglodytarum]|uniref:Anaphase-promoting complex subunit n=1 Tax=Musa troglodytarum TaxID=320322 RepID=A0A9E7JJ85_9LILI|nr:Anaphase-promoting complex subunit [Musa troglodytarum]
MSSKESYRVELRSAARQLSDRCLYSAAKWAAELLIDIEPDAHAPASSASSSAASARATPSTSSAARPLSHLHPAASAYRRRLRSAASSGDIAATPPAGVSYISTPVPDDDGFNSDGGNDRYLLAKSYFDCRDYRRAAHALRGQTGKKAGFLRCYALYLAGEKRKEEEMIELDGSLGKSDVVNSELISLERELSSLRRIGSIDSFGLYLYGLVLKDKGCESLAVTVFVESVNSFPWNWSAWSELQSLCTSTDTLNKLNLKNHWMKDFFLASAYQELKMHEEALKRYECLLGVFRSSDYIQSQIATALYSLRELDEAEVIFEDLLRNDPYRVESMDIYSNLLYAKECFSALSFLAHRVFLTDKYRPESCCIIANYYSLKGQHEKSVLYFRRALKLNRKYLSAWTLMGHEYVEMKNTPAAIDAYRRAIEINPRDYRAWYGLGQTYEVMNMPFYALYYFRKSSYLQPNDSRLWIAMAQCYESAPLQMLEEAIKCYTRAANSNDSEGIALHQLAKLHGVLGHSEQAAFFYKKDLERMEAEGRQGPNMVEAMLYLARYYKSEKKLEEAEFYCTRLLDYTGEGDGKKSSERIEDSSNRFSLDGHWTFWFMKFFENIEKHNIRPSNTIACNVITENQHNE